MKMFEFVTEQMFPFTLSPNCPAMNGILAMMGAYSLL
jgi:hypothetical protein